MEPGIFWSRAPSRLPAQTRVQDVLCRVRVRHARLILCQDGLVEQIPERETRYVKTADGYVGYQVFGSGPIDLLFISAWSSNLDVMWQEPTLARYLDRLASFARVMVVQEERQSALLALVSSLGFCSRNLGRILGQYSAVLILALLAVTGWLQEVYP